MASNINIGKLIHDELKRQKRSVTWLACQLGTNRTQVYRLFEKQSIDTELLLKISTLLNYDFFSLYSSAITENIQSMSQNCNI